MASIFGDFDWTDFWQIDEYAIEYYVGEPVTDDQITSVEGELGVKLPASYIELIRQQNGGVPNRRALRADSSASGDVEITGIYGVDRKKASSLCGRFSSQFWSDEWEYPSIGVYICDCPSGGHDMVCLDYRDCGPEGEPSVVHVDQESDFVIIRLAPDFETFIRRLEEVEKFR